jgi:hypothetical protein
MQIHAYEYSRNDNSKMREFLRTRRDVYEPEWKDVDNGRLSITDLAGSLHTVQLIQLRLSFQSQN